MSKARGDWEEKLSEKYNKKYFFNRVTGEKSWTMPAELRREEKQKEKRNESRTRSDSRDDDEPPIFEEFYSKILRCRFWLNALTKEVSFSDPLSPWERRFSETYGRPYWKHRETGEKTWMCPASLRDEQADGEDWAEDGMGPPPDADVPVTPRSLRESGRSQSMSNFADRDHKKVLSMRSTRDSDHGELPYGEKGSSPLTRQNMKEHEARVTPAKGGFASLLSKFSMSSNKHRDSDARSVHSTQSYGGRPSMPPPAPPLSSSSNNNRGRSSSIGGGVNPLDNTMRSSFNGPSNSILRRSPRASPSPSNTASNTVMNSRRPHGAALASVSESHFPFQASDANRQSRLNTTVSALTDGSDGSNKFSSPRLETTPSKKNGVDKSSGDFIVRTYGGYSQGGTVKSNGVVSPAGQNKDALLMEEDARTKSLLVAVMDGHGPDGHKIAQYLQAKLAGYVFGHADFRSDIPTAIWEGVDKCEAELHSNGSIDTEFSGATLTIAVIRDRTCILANIGDSGSSLAYRTLTTDHKPDVPEERARIERAGGEVRSVREGDPAQVCAPGSNKPLLAVSRAVGNFYAKPYGVTSEPEFFSYSFHSAGRTDLALVSGSDGLWAFLSDEEAIRAAVSADDPAQAVNSLLKTSQDRWHKYSQACDDITIGVVYLNPLSGVSSGGRI